MVVINPALSIRVNCASKAENEIMRKNFSFNTLGSALKFQGFHKDLYCTMAFFNAILQVLYSPKHAPYKCLRSAQEKLRPKTNKVSGQFKISDNEDLHGLNMPPSIGMVSIFGRL
jgi:hypothetical protein